MDVLRPSKKRRVTPDRDVGYSICHQQQEEIRTPRRRERQDCGSSQDLTCHHDVEELVEPSLGLAACSPDDLALFAQSSKSVAKCTVEDAWKMRSLQNFDRDRSIFLLDQYPTRQLEIVAWVQSVSYEPTTRKDDMDPPYKAIVMLDDGDGHVLPVIKRLEYKEVPHPYLYSAPHPKVPSRSASLPPPTQAPPDGLHKYITVAERAAQNRANSLAKSREDYPEEPRMMKEHKYLGLQVGDVVRVRGRLKEWVWKRSGRTMREMVVEGDDMYIRRCRHREEALHKLEVDYLRKSLYSHPFNLPAILEPKPITALPTQRTVINVTQNVRESISFSSMGLESQASPSSGAKLRDPSKLKSKYLTIEQFTLYVTVHLQEDAIRHWPSEIGSEHALKHVSLYLPEIVERKTGPGSDLFLRLPARPITLSELKEVPELKEFARRMIRREARKQVKMNRSGGTSSTGNVDIDPAFFKKMFDKVFLTSVRKLARNGNIIECDLLTEDIQDLDRQRHHRSLNLKRKGSRSPSPSPAAKRPTLRDVSNLGHSSSSSIPIESDEEYADSSPLEKTGFLPLTLPILGPVILQVLRGEEQQRMRKYIPKADPRRDNGMPISEVAERLTRLAHRWERVPIQVIEDGVADLMDVGLVEIWGNGVWRK